MLIKNSGLAADDIRHHSVLVAAVNVRTADYGRDYSYI